MSWGRFAFAPFLMGLALGPACLTYEPAPPVTRAPVTTRERPSAPEMISVRQSRYDVPELSGLDTLVVVFSAELDPLGVEAGAFAVGLADGRTATPKRASMWPAHERGELRTVLVEVELGAPVEAPPVNLTVVGHLYAADGQDLRGETALIVPFSRPDTLVSAHPVDGDETDCPGNQGAIRTYWSDVLRPLEPEAHPSLRVVLEGDREVSVTHVADQEPMSRADNVLDLCVSSPAEVVKVRVPAQALTDVAGNPVGPVDAVVR